MCRGAHCNTYCNTLQHATTRYNTLQHEDDDNARLWSHFFSWWREKTGGCNTLYHTAMHCNAHMMTSRAWSHFFSCSLQTATHCNTLLHTAAHCSTLPRTATYRNAHQQTALQWCISRMCFVYCVSLTLCVSLSLSCVSLCLSHACQLLCLCSFLCVSHMCPVKMIGLFCKRAL